MKKRSLIKFLLFSMVIGLFLPFFSSKSAHAQELSHENSAIILANPAASSIYWRDESVFDYGPTKTVTINLGGTHYRGTLSYSGKSSWLYIYTGYLYKVGYDVYANKAIE